MGVMPIIDKAYFWYNQWRYRKLNRSFTNAHPGFRLPPDYMLYEAYRMNYTDYFKDGRETASWIASQVRPFLKQEPGTVLEWGCGPARIIRHLPDIWSRAEIIGTDYNLKTVNWCRQNIPEVRFTANELNPPLPFPDFKFDLVYAISIFTHLSEQNHYLWINELKRVLRPGGVALITTQGEAFIEKLSAVERQEFREGKLVTRGKVKEGHRAYSAFQPMAFMERLFDDNWQIGKWIRGSQKEWGPEQDTWILVKL
jgi:ubiquinone/menaquinone biosynthesis C-methylase UbiE